MYIDVASFYNDHRMGEHATRPIAPVLTRPALLLLLAWSVVVAALAALQPRPTPCGWNDHAASALTQTLWVEQLAIRLGCPKTTAKSLVIPEGEGTIALSPFGRELERGLAPSRTSQNRHPCRARIRLPADTVTQAVQHAARNPCFTSDAFNCGF